MYRKGFDTYRQTNILTADPKRLVLMCYQGAIDNIKTAKRRFVEHEYEAKAKAVQKAQDIIDELRYSLDFEKGGEIAANLERLYNYMTRRLLHGDANGDIEPFEEVIGILEELKGAWEEISYVSKKHGDMVTYGSMSNQYDNPVLSAAYGPPART